MSDSNEYWESRFLSEGAMWKFEPCNSAIKAVMMFKNERINKILIPGFGYGRNARTFIDNGFEVTGIEISSSAIDLARNAGLTCIIHHGSVISMPFDEEIYDGIFCYAVIHLLNKNDRQKFLKSCYSQLRSGGLMFFTIASKKGSLYGKGKYLSKNRYEIAKGLNTFFYDKDSAAREFAAFGKVEIQEIEEPVKFIDGEEPVKLISVICRK